MKLSVTRAALLLALPLSIAVISCQKKAKGDDVVPSTPSPVELRFTNKVGVDTLAIGTTYATSGTLEFFKVTNFKYYISNIQFVSSDNGDTIKIPETYFLIDELKPASKKVQFNIPSGNYYGLSFLIGVDSARSVSGAQTGALDPSLGMFWDRTNGYIAVKFEGTSPTSPLPGNVFTYSVGGFKEPYNVLQRRHFKFGNVAVSPKQKTVINLSADLRAWFTNPNTMSIAAHPSVTGPGADSKKYSENYFKMFDFVSVKFE